MSRLSNTFVVETGSLKEAIKEFLDDLARGIGLSLYEEGDTSRYEGRTVLWKAEDFARHLDAQRLIYTWKRPGLEELKTVELKEMFSALGPRSLDLLGLSGKNVADLTRCSFSDIVAAQRNLPDWQALAAILRFMIDYSVDFRDYSPRNNSGHLLRC